jgi:hypothetical protein
VKLTRVTITGADDGVDPGALIDLSASFPFVEWAFLRSRKLNEVQRSDWYTTGAPRYPSPAWRDGFSLVVRSRGARVQIAAHLCGALSREAMAGDDRWHWADARGYQRVQLNGFSRYRLPMLRVAQQFTTIEFILQTADLASEHHGLELAKLHPNVVNLLDASGGRGEVAVWAERPEPRLGYAGGIGPDNVVAQIEHLLSYKTEQDFWIDMESGVRTDDHFDLTKVGRVLELAKPFVSESA